MTRRSPVRPTAPVAGWSAPGVAGRVIRLTLLALALLMGVPGGLGACESLPPSPAAPSPAPSRATSPSTSTALTTATAPSAPNDTGSTTGPGDATRAYAGAPFVAAATWVRGSGGRSLHVRPTAAGRAAQGLGDAAEAWREVLRLAPDADQPGMQDQFDCHWAYARLVEPDKATWNLEPWRPVVSAQELAAAACNPGGPESADG